MINIAETNESKTHCSLRVYIEFGSSHDENGTYFIIKLLNQYRINAFIAVSLSKALTLQMQRFICSINSSTDVIIMNQQNSQLCLVEIFYR